MTKKVTAFVGCARKKHTYQAVGRFLEYLRSQGDIETEIVVLSDYQIKPCRGCKVCFGKGEEFCPLKDDRDALIAKMDASDGVVFASPNYSFQVSALMKLFLDRLGFVLHRPRFFGKTFTSIVAQGFYGGKKIERYLDFIGQGLGFNTVPGCVITALEPMTDKEESEVNARLAKQSRRFAQSLNGRAYPSPSFLMLMGFRGGRMNVKLDTHERSRDFTYYTEKGWLESDYFYPARLGLLKKVFGSFFDRFSGRRIEKRIALFGPAYEKGFSFFFKDGPKER